MVGDRGEGTPFQGLIERLSAHVRQRRVDAVVALVGSASGAAHEVADTVASRLVGGAAVAAPARFLRADSRRIDEGTALRRFTVLDEAGTIAEAAAALSGRLTKGGAADGCLLFVDLVDWLDEDSLCVLDEIVGDGRVNVLLSSTTDPQRYADVLRSDRGIVAENPPLTRRDAAELVRRVTGGSPTAHTLDYLVHLAGGARGWLHRVTGLGVLEEWLATADGVTAIARPPIRMHERWAEQIVRSLRGLVSVHALRLLERVAMSGSVRVRALMTDAESRQAVVLLERAGVLRMADGRCSFAVPALRDALIASPPRTDHAGALWAAATADGDEERSAFMAFRAGVALTDDELVRGAYAELERASFAQAFALLNASAGMGGGPRYALAALEALSGRPWHAIEGLRRDQEAPADDPHAVRMADVYIRYIQETCFPFAAVGMRQMPGLTADDGLPPAIRDYAAAVERMREYNAMFRLVPVERPRSGHAPALDWRVFAGSRSADVETDRQERAEPAVAGVRIAGGLERITALVTAACAAAMTGGAESRTAERLLARLDDEDWSALPGLGAGWCLERLGIARLLTRFDDDPVPQRFIGTPERGLMASIPLAVLDVFGAVLRGDPQEELRRRMSDLWAEHSTGLPQGTLSRAAVEALDTLVASVDYRRPHIVADPPFVSGAHATDPLARFAGETARLLRIPAEGLGDDPLLRSLEHQCLTEGTSGIPRAMLRTLVLRRAGSLPPEVCERLLAPTVAAGVEPEFRALLAARAERSDRAWEAACDAIASSHPRVRVAPLASETVDSAPRLIREALAVLTEREVSVVSRLVEGESTAEIAEALGIAPRTAETHVRNVYRKLGVHSRTELRAEVVR